MDLTTLVILIASLSPAGLAVPADSLPAPIDLVSGYRQNLALFRTLHVEWRQSHRYTDGWFRVTEWEAKEAELRASADTPASERDRHRRNAEQTRSVLASPVYRSTQWFNQDYWTDRSRFQIRIAQTDGADKGQKWQFPTSPLTTETLKTDYRNVYILSYPGRGDLGFRVWDGGRGPEGRFSASVRLNNTNEEFFQFPPLGVTDRQWGTRWHRFDDFFARPVEEMKVVGTEIIDGRMTYIVDHTEIETDVEKIFAKDLHDRFRGRVQRHSVVRAWIDASRGCLPLRMEWFGFFVCDRKRVGRDTVPAKNPSADCIEHVQITKVEGAGYYPVNGVTRLYRADNSKVKESIPRLEEYLEGKTVPQPVPVVLTEETRWEVLGVEANLPMGDFFALAFPENTSYADERQGKHFVTGSAQQYLDGVIGPEGTPPLEERQRDWRMVGLILGNVVAVAVLAGILRYRRRRAGAPT